MRNFLTQRLKVRDYGVFSLYRGTQLIPKSDVSTLIVDAVADLPAVKRVFDTDDFDWMAVTAIYSAEAEDLIFDFGGEVEIPLSDTLQRQGIKVVGPRKVSRQAAARISQRQTVLRNKLAAIPNTTEESYLLHVNQCGYLLKNTKLYFVHTQNQWSSSVKTSILDLPIEQLRLFVDATGFCSMLSVSPHAEIVADAGRKSILATTREFAEAIVDFLNLEFVVDVGGILAEYAQIVGDSNFQLLEHWGGTREVVLQRLVDRRPASNATTVTEYFDAGYNGELV